MTYGLVVKYLARDEAPFGEILDCLKSRGLFRFSILPGAGPKKEFKCNWKDFGRYDAFKTLIQLDKLISREDNCEKIFNEKRRCFYD